MKKTLVSLAALLVTILVGNNPANSKSDVNNSLAKIPAAYELASNPSYLNGTWIGTYVCAQGLTSVRLNISAKNDNNIDAVFSFYANANNVNVPPGSFRMKGRKGRTDHPLDHPALSALG